MYDTQSKMSTIKSYVDELEQIQEEIKRNSKRNSILRVRAKELEYNISEYLASKGQHGLKYKGRAILVQNREKRQTKNRKDKETSVVSLLQEAGVDDAEELYTRLVDVQKKDPVAETKIKFTKLKNSQY